MTTMLVSGDNWDVGYEMLLSLEKWLILTLTVGSVGHFVPVTLFLRVGYIPCKTSQPNPILRTKL